MDNEYFISLALEEAKKAEAIGEVPVGCVVVKDNQVIATGYNQQITGNNPIYHAEIVALQNAGKILGNHRLVDTTVFVSLEPCAMCFGAMIHARVKNIVFGAYDRKTGVCGSCIDLGNQPCFNHKINILGGVLEEKCKTILQDFFKQKRKNKNTIAK